ncbi:MAG TPA: FGGY family carbohydrate kinase [Terriglobia bacterium]|jgi:sugar (pentulose or hexulose) kinase|nr:FGGY family carbohydrate kinase [Terriglobia bacterium]
MRFIGVDLGTSFIKGAVLNLETLKLEHVQRSPFPTPIPSSNPLWCEFDPAKIVSVTGTLINELAALAPDCDGMVMCSQMHGMVLLDGRNHPVSNCLSWRDQRAVMPHPSGSGTYYDLVVARTTAGQRQQLGNELDPARPLCFLFWFAEQGALAPGLMPVSMPDFVLSALCASTPGVEITNASAYGALNLETLDWHHDVIKQLRLDGLRWPNVRKHGEVVGHMHLGGRRVPCYTPVGDYQAAMVGALLGEDEISLNIATGSQVSRMTPGLALGDYQTRPFFDGKFLNTFSYPPGGRALDVIIDLLSELARFQGIQLRDPWATITRAVKPVAETDLEVDLNFFPSPRGDRGRIANIHGGNLRVGHLFRAAFDHMAESFYDCALRLWPEESWKTIVFSGGLATKLEALRDTIQKRFGIGCRLTPCAEDTLFGLLILASVFSGRARSVTELTRQLRLSYEPSPHTGIVSHQVESL